MRQADGRRCEKQKRAGERTLTEDEDDCEDDESTDEGSKASSSVVPEEHGCPWGEETETTKGQGHEPEDDGWRPSGAGRARLGGELVVDCGHGCGETLSCESRNEIDARRFRRLGAVRVVRKLGPISH